MLCFVLHALHIAMVGRPVVLYPGRPSLELLRFRFRRDPCDPRFE